MKKLLSEHKIITAILVLIISSLSIPIGYVVKDIFTENSSYIEILLSEGILIDYVLNTLELILKVSFFSGAIGFLSAYFLSIYDFKFRKLISTLMILPLSIPIYVGAYTYAGIYQDLPFLKTLLKNNFTMNGAVFIYTAFLFPYVFLASRSYLKKYLGEYIEASKTLGGSLAKTFIKVIVPISRPVISGSVMFVIFETLSDFAVVNFYGVGTLSKIINDSWHNLGQKETASKLSVLMLIILFVLIFLERFSRRRKRYSVNDIKTNQLQSMSTLQKVGMYCFYSIISLLTFILPVSYLVKYAIANYQYLFKPELWLITMNTLTTTMISIAIILVVAFIASSLIRELRTKNKQLLGSLVVMGYAIPSIVLALGIYSFLIDIDKVIYPLTSILGYRGYLFTGTSLALITALSIKFLSIAFTHFQATFEKTSNSIFEASQVLGKNRFQTMTRINLPLLKNTIPYAMVLIFIDLIKELTLTYSLRPFNFKTLATEVYRYAGNEMLETAAVPGLIIVSFSLVCIVLIEGGKKNVKSK